MFGPLSRLKKSTAILDNGYAILTMILAAIL